MVPKDNQDLIKIQQAHDRLFRESMQDIDIAWKLSSLNCLQEFKTVSFGIH